jgi:hypothetical protein
MIWPLNLLMTEIPFCGRGDSTCIISMILETWEELTLEQKLPTDTLSVDRKNKGCSGGSLRFMTSLVRIGA